MGRSTPWKDDENGATVELYFAMLDAEMDGERYSKADMIRAYRGEPQASWDAGIYSGILSGRSRGSVEFKLMNASACHADLRPNDETMHGHGYRALPNYQAGLKSAMQAKLEELDAEASDRPAAAG